MPGQELQQCPAGSLRGVQGAQMQPGVPWQWVKKLHPLARCHSPQSVKGAQLAPPGRRAKKEQH